MLAGRGGIDNGRQKTRKSWLWRHCRRRAIYRLLRSISQTCHAKPKTQINRRRTLQLLPVGGMPTASSLAWKTSPKSQDAWHCSRLRSVALYLWLIAWWYPSGNRPLQQYLGFTAGALVMVSSSIRLTAWLQNSKKRRNGQRDWCMSRVTAIISACYLHHRLPVMGC